MRRTISINQKTVLAAEPYVAPAGALVGRERELRLLAASWAAGCAPLLVGDPGAGKTRIAIEAARATGQPIYVVQASGDMTAEDLVVQVRFSDVDARRMDYCLSPLASAAVAGAVVVLDEALKLPEQALVALIPLTDGRRYLDSVLLGERVTAESGFKLVLTTNSADLARCPDFIRSRLRPQVRVALPPREEIDAMIEAQYAAALGASTAPVLEEFWTQWRFAAPAAQPTPRDVLGIVGLAVALAGPDAGCPGRRHMEAAVLAYVGGGAE